MNKVFSLILLDFRIKKYQLLVSSLIYLLLMIGFSLPLRLIGFQHHVASFLELFSFCVMGRYEFHDSRLTYIILFMIFLFALSPVPNSINGDGVKGYQESITYRMSSRMAWYAGKSINCLLTLLIVVILLALSSLIISQNVSLEYSSEFLTWFSVSLADTPIQAYQFFAFLAEFFLLLLALSQIQLIVSLRFNNAAGISTSLVLVLFHQFFYVPYSPFYYGTVLRSPVMGIGSQSILPSWYPAVSLFVCYLVLLLIGYYVVKRMDFYCVRENL